MTACTGLRRAQRCAGRSERVGFFRNL